MRLAILLVDDLGRLVTRKVAPSGNQGWVWQLQVDDLGSPVLVPTPVGVVCSDDFAPPVR